MDGTFEKNNLCILIPTYNRSDAVDYYLKNKLDCFRNLHIDVILYDSSKDDLTKNTAIKYMARGYDCLKYKYYKDPADDLYGTRKIADALLECANNYEYVWLCGDQAILMFEEYLFELSELFKNEIDVIHIYTNKIGRNSDCYMDYKDFFLNFFWSMTHFCAFILSKRIIKKMDKWMTKYLEMKCSMAIVFAIFAVLPSEKFKIAYINHVVYECSPYRTLSVAAQNKEMLKGYAEAISVGIDNLPMEYNNIKKSAKKTFCKNTGNFSWQSAIDLRSDGNLTFKNIQKYGKYLRDMTDVPFLWFYFWSIIPKRIARKNSNSYEVNVEGINKLHEINEIGGRLILYGAGEHGIRILKKIKYSYNKIKIIAVSDKNSPNIESEYPIIPPEDIAKYKYDYVGIAIVNQKIFKDVKKTLIKLHIPKQQIFHI